MSRKRRIFDINMPPSDGVTAEPTAEVSAEKRRGPMAAAISENADALRDRRSAEEAIRAENDQLAHEFVRLRDQGLVTDLLPLDVVRAEKLTRDREAGPDPDLEELKTSIREIGLSNPIRVERQDDGHYELIQGMRRLSAYRALYHETGDDRFARIPAGILAHDQVDASYRRMVDENLIRKDISFAEMGKLAQAYAADAANDCPDVDKAVAVLFKSASYTKRSYIRAFASLVSTLGDDLLHPNSVPRNLGVSLKRKLDSDPGLRTEIASALSTNPERTDIEEVSILKTFVEDKTGESKAADEGPSNNAKTRRAKTTFQVGGSKGVAKCSASNGRIDLKYDLDFTRIDRRKLEQAVAQLLKDLGGD